MNHTLIYVGRAQFLYKESMFSSQMWLGIRGANNFDQGKENKFFFLKEL